MVHPLYLQPPTLGEFIWASYAPIESPREAFALIQKSYNNNSTRSIIRRKFEPPEGLTLHNDFILNMVLRTMHTNDEYCDEITEPNEMTDHESINRFYEILKPQATFDRYGGDCKSFAIFAVVFKRKMGQPTRFCAKPTSDHVVIEECSETGFWQRRDPKQFPIKRSFSGITPEYDYTYEKILELLNTPPLSV